MLLYTAIFSENKILMQLFYFELFKLLGWKILEVVNKFRYQYKHFFLVKSPKSQNICSVGHW